MAVTITKTKPKAAEKVVVPEQAHDEPVLDPAKMTIEQLADAYGEYEDKTEALLADPAFARFDMLKKELVTRLNNDYKPEQELTVVGEHWKLEVGAQARSPAEIKDMPKAAKLLGPVFMQVAKVTLTDLKKYLTPEQLAQVLNEDTGYTSRRKITAAFLGG